MILSAKYDMLHPPLVSRILAEESQAKDPVKAAKTRLHQLYGAYVQGNAHKKAASLLTAVASSCGNSWDRDSWGADIESAAQSILRLHASTKERLPHLIGFYEFVATHTGQAETIMDLGCGFNPFSIPLMPTSLSSNLKSYHAFDIDTRTRDILNRFFSLLKLPPTAECIDLAVETSSHSVDVALMCKLLPVLEAQIPGRGFELAAGINTRFLVITYPLKSLGGRDKGMEKNYSNAFEKAISAGAMGRFTPIARERVGNELVYILAISQTKSVWF